MAAPSSARGDEGLSLQTLLVASAASAGAAIIVSLFWQQGTIMAAAITPVLIALLREVFHRPAEAIATVRPPRGAATARTGAGAARAPTARATTVGAAGALAGATKAERRRERETEPFAGETAPTEGATRRLDATDATRALAPAEEPSPRAEDHEAEGTDGAAEGTAATSPLTAGRGDAETERLGDFVGGDAETRSLSGRDERGADTSPL